MDTKVCSKCRLEKPKSEFSPRPERRCGVYSSCKACKANFRSKRHYERRADDPHEYWVVRTRIGVKDRASKAAVHFELTDDDLRVLLEESRLCCAYCDKQLDFHTDVSDRWNAPSLDRIVPSKGYVLENVTICCYRCNMIKSEATADELRRLAERVEHLILIKGLMER